MATGRTNHIAELASIVEMLKEAGAGSKRDVHVVSLQRNSAQAVSTMISQLFAKQVASTDPADRLVLSALQDDRTLVVEAAEKTFERVSDVVKKIDDTETSVQNVIQTVHLKKGRADNLAEGHQCGADKSPRHGAGQASECDAGARRKQPAHQRPDERG